MLYLRIRKHSGQKATSYSQKDRLKVDGQTGQRLQSTDQGGDPLENELLV